MKTQGMFIALGGAFVLPLLYLGDDQWGLALYFFVTGSFCLAVSRIRLQPRVLAAAGFTIIGIACGIYLAEPALALLTAVVMGCGISMANVALLDEASCTNNFRQLLVLQAFMAVGNATPPLLAVAGLRIPTIVLGVGLLAIVMALILFVRNDTRAALESGSGANLSLAACSGLATAVQLGLVLAAQEVVQTADLQAAIWIGTSCGIVVGRVVASILGERLTWRFAAGLALASAVLVQLFPIAAGGTAVAVLAFTCAALLGPVFPLVLAVAYTRPNKAPSRLSVRPGPLALAVSIAISGMVPLVLGLTDGRWATNALTVVGLVLAVLLFSLPQHGKADRALSPSQAGIQT